MKRPQPDISEFVVFDYIQRQAFLRKFIRYWGTTTVNGEEVLIGKRYYYKSMDANMVKLTKMLGIYTDLQNARMKGISSAWLWLNPLKTGIPDYDLNIIAENLNLALGTGITARLIIGPRIEPASKRSNSTTLTPPPINTSIVDQPGIIAEVIAEYSTYFYGGYYTTSTSKYDPYLDILTRYILLSSDIPYTVTEVKKTYTDVEVPYYTFDYSLAEQVIGFKSQTVDAYEVIIDIPQYSILSTTDIVSSIKTDTETGLIDSFRITKTQLEFDPNSDNLDRIPVEYTQFTFNDLNNFWVNGGTLSQPVYYLKTSALTGNVLKLQQKIDLISGALDSGYREKSTSFWEQIIPIIVFIVVVYLSYGYASSAGYGALAASSFAVSMGALSLALLTAVAAGTGNYAIARASAQFSKGIAPLVMLASIISIYGALKNLAIKGATEAGKQAATSAAAETAQITVENVFRGLQAEFTDLLSKTATDISFEQVMRGLNFLFDQYKSTEFKDLQKELKSIEAQLGEEEEAKERSKAMDILEAVSKAQYSPMQRDWSFYASIYDRPYERWSSDMHIGNIQSTTVNALWLSDRKNGII